MALPELPEWDERQKLMWEKEVLGFFLSSHPLQEHLATLQRYCPCTTEDLPSRAGPQRDVPGRLDLVRSRTSHVKKARREGEPTKYVNFDLEDTHGSVRCIMWPTEYERFGESIQPDAILIVRALVDRRGGGDEVNLIVQEVIQMADIERKCARHVRVRLDEGDEVRSQLKQLHSIATRFPGDCELQIDLQLQAGPRVCLKSQSLRVDSGPGFRDCVADLLSPASVDVAVAPLKGEAAKPQRRGPRSD